MAIKKRTLKIGSRLVGDGQPVFIIAEAGVNHNGDVKLAKKLIDAAKAAKADAVKFQTFEAEEVVTTEGEMASYQKRNTGKTESQLDMLKRLALSDDDFRVLAAYAKEKGIIFLSTSHSGFHSVDILEELKVPAFKFGSADLNNFPILAYAARLKKPMIISSGMSDMAGIKEAVACIKKAGGDKIVLFQCTTDYPAQLSDTNLRAMVTMKDAFKDVIIGYSDHTVGSQTSVMAVTLGACVLEKHLTLDNDMDGPDHKASANPKDFAEYVEAIRNVEVILGSAEKTVATASRQYIPLVFKSVVARGAIKKGETFTRANLAIKRPAKGLPPKYYFEILGKKATRDIAHDSFIKKTDYGSR